MSQISVKFPRPQMKTDARLTCRASEKSLQLLNALEIFLLNSEGGTKGVCEAVTEPQSFHSSPVIHHLVSSVVLVASELLEKSFTHSSDDGIKTVLAAEPRQHFTLSINCDKLL